MSDEINAGHVAAGLAGGLVGGAVAGVPGFIVGSGLGALAADAYQAKPAVQSHSTTVRNDIAPENVTLDAYQIYVRITTGYGSNTLSEANATADELSKRFADERAGQIAEARRTAAEAWQGNASTAADAATAPLSDSFAMAQQQLAANSQALNAELTAWDHIFSQVEPVPENPPQGGIANSVNPFQTDVDAAINEYNAAAAKNVALYEAYSAETATARGQVPQSYLEPAPLSASSAAGAPTRTASAIGSESVAPPQVGGAADAGQPAGTGASAASGGSPSAPPSPGGGAAGKPDGTSGQGVAAAGPTARPTPSASRPTPSASRPVANTPALQAPRNTVAAGQLPQPKPTGLSDTPRKFTGAGGGGVGSGGSGGVGSFGGVAAPGGVGTGSGNSLRGGGSVGTGPVPGQVPGGQGQPAGRGGVGTPGARGAAGAGGFPASPAGRANGEEDKEHRRKYLIEPDDKELFGIDERYVPPVIGDNR
ncbi:hypothetical protein [Actinophytocola sp.]|uniref:hypothetical protein n=1 Tax=Actinophytocola sp. TaxID=1872138 RepID=UPI002ED01278